MVVMLPIEPLPVPEYEDGQALNSMKYRDVVHNCKIGAINPNQFATTNPLLFTSWDNLTNEFDKYYANYEIVGETELDFFNNLTVELNTHKDTIERLLEVYNDDVAKPILGRMEKHTYNLTNSNTGTNNNNSQRIDIPIDDTTSEKPTFKDKAVGVSSSTDTQTGTHTVELSDLGVRPNYETLNGFLYNNVTATRFFNECFRNCFWIYEVLRW